MTQSKIYLGNLDKKVTPELLKETFSQYGEVAEVALPMDVMTAQIKGYAFITFTQEDAAQKALEKDGTSLEGQAISVQIAIEKERGTKR